MAPAPVDLWAKGSSLLHSNLLDPIRSFYFSNKKEPPPPVISERTAFFCATLFTLLYVAPFYVSPTLRTSAVTSRDAPAVIRARVRAVTVTSLACVAFDVYLLAVHGHATTAEILRLCGIWPSNALDVIRVLALVTILFTCVLYESILVDGEWRRWSLAACKEGVWDSWVGFRNLLIAPLTEELVFRALVIPLFLLARSSALRIVFLTPLIFGLAHLHHLFAFMQARKPAGRVLPPLNVFLHGLVMSLFQFTYTSLFGFFAAFVFLRTGNLYAIIIAHSFCNHMGLPRLWGRVGQRADNELPVQNVTPDITQGKRDDSSAIAGGATLNKDTASSASPRNASIAWTVVYYALLGSGAYAFYKLLLPLTESTNALVDF